MKNEWILPFVALMLAILSITFIFYSVGYSLAIEKTNIWDKGTVVVEDINGILYLGQVSIGNKGQTVVIQAEHTEHKMNIAMLNKITIFLKENNDKL